MFLETNHDSYTLSVPSVPGKVGGISENLLSLEVVD